MCEAEPRPGYACEGGRQQSSLRGIDSVSERERGISCRGIFTRGRKTRHHGIVAGEKTNEHFRNETWYWRCLYTVKNEYGKRRGLRMRLCRFEKFKL